MAIKPAVTWIGSPNFGFPDQTHGQNEPEAIVYHVAQGSLGGMDIWFNNPASLVSTHFAVGLRGEIHQYVKAEDAAWGNGYMNKPDLTIPWLRYCWYNEINPNLKTISIEHEGFTGDPWPEAMYRSSLALTIWLVDAYHLRHALVAVDHGLIGHRRIDSVSKANDPGTGWPRSRLFQDLGRLKDVYAPRNRNIYWRQTFDLPGTGTTHDITIDVGAHGYPAEATAVDLLLGCRSRGDGAFLAAYDGTIDRLDRVAIFPTAPLRHDWNFNRGRVQLEGSKFLLKIGHTGYPVDVFAILKGYYALE